MCHSACDDVASSYRHVADARLCKLNEAFGAYLSNSLSNPVTSLLTFTKLVPVISLLRFTKLDNVGDSRMYTVSSAADEMSSGRNSSALRVELVDSGSRGTVN